MEEPRAPQPPRPSRLNPLQSGIWNYLCTSKAVVTSSNKDPTSGLVRPSSLPKRYTLYPPMLLLPANFPCVTNEWYTIYSNLTTQERQRLFDSVASAFQARHVTHIAINASISPENVETGDENLMRSPTGLLPVHGDFGPTKLSHVGQPSDRDFEQACWVSAVQNGGIVQIWAPIWTMFSRGNLGEKARILGSTGQFDGLNEETLCRPLAEVDVIDFYVGIGYFAFSYLKRGVKRVWGWEINGWSVEGLRRGCEENGLHVLILRVSDDGVVEDGSLEDLVQQVTGPDESKARCIVFHGDNRWAQQVIGRVNALLAQQDPSNKLHIKHANLGLLPTSKESWQGAVACLDGSGAWMHIHENADVEKISAKTDEIVDAIARLVRQKRKEAWTVTCCHVEFVKTYAPGVMHCVFDIAILPTTWHSCLIQPLFSLLLPKFHWYVPFDNLLLLFFGNPLFLILHLIMLPEMRDILRMDQILLPCVFIVEFLKVVDFIFVFVITVMAWSQVEIWYSDARGGGNEKRVSTDHTTTSFVKQCENLLDCVVLDFLARVLV